METTLKQTLMPTQLLHFSVDIEMPRQVKFNQESIQEAFKLLLQNYSQAFGASSPEQILHNLGIHQTKITDSSDALPANGWEKMLERLGQDAMSPKEITEFDKSRQKFRDNFIMRDVDVMDDETK